MSSQQGPPGGGPPPPPGPPPSGPPPSGPPPPPGYPPPGYGYGYGAPPQPGYNGLAIASLVVGVSFWWTYGVGAVVALILGLIAKRQIRERGERGGALATAGIVLGILGIIGAVVLVALIIAFGESTDDSDLFDESLRRPAVTWVSPDPVAGPPQVVFVPARR